ncbi:MAG: DHH family phosphoesterase, partial [Verrucomicrobiota bacterium]
MASSGGFPPILEHLIRQRGLPEGVGLEEYLQPRLRDLADPFLLPDMLLAVERILLAADRKETVCIFGDYDVDGVTSITLMRRILRAYGLDARHFIPKRGTEGYGLSQAALVRCMRDGTKPDLLIAVDCGTTSLAEVASLRADGIDVLIFDHHEPGAA